MEDYLRTTLVELLNYLAGLEGRIGEVGASREASTIAFERAQSLSNAAKDIRDVYDESEWTPATHGLLGDIRDGRQILS